MGRMLLIALILWPANGFSATDSATAEIVSYPQVKPNEQGSMVLIDEAGAKIQTKVFDLEYLGTLDAEEGDPYYVFEGIDCQDCGDQKFVYMVRKDGANPMRFVYPGKIRDARSRRLLYEGKAYFGRCLRHGEKQVFLMHQQEKLDRRRYLQTSVYIAEPTSDGVKEQIIVRGRPRLSHIERQVRRKKCFKIKGKDRITISARRRGPI